MRYTLGAPCFYSDTSKFPGPIYPGMSTNIPCENMDIARASAGELVWDNLVRQINSRDVTAATVRSAAIAVYGIRWGRSVITALTAKRIADVLALLQRYTPFPAREYGRLAPFPKDSYAVSTSSPPDLFEWRRLAEHLRLDLSLGWEVILATAVFLQAQGIPMPFVLGALPPADLQPLIKVPPNLSCYEPCGLQRVRPKTRLWGEVIWPRRIR